MNKGSKMKKNDSSNKTNIEKDKMTKRLSSFTKSFNWRVNKF